MTARRAARSQGRPAVAPMELARYTGDLRDADALRESAEARLAYAGRADAEPLPSIGSRVRMAMRSNGIWKRDYSARDQVKRALDPSES